MANQVTYEQNLMTVLGLIGLPHVLGLGSLQSELSSTTIVHMYILQTLCLLASIYLAPKVPSKKERKKNVVAPEEMVPF